MATTAPRSPRAVRRSSPANSPLVDGLKALHRGDFSHRLSKGDGVDAEVAAAFNSLAERNARLCEELQRIAGAVGRHGDLAGRAVLPGAAGGWSVSVTAVNRVIRDLVHPMTEVASVIDAVAQGDLSRKMPTEMEGRPIKGEFLRTTRTVNRMVEQLKAFASEVTRVAREVGTEGKLGGQAQVKGVAGTWKDLTHSVNSMAANLTSQVRNIADVTTAVARGDLSKKITVDVKGEILELKNTINTMVDQLSTFASEVTRVAREVGTEGKLGGQARVKGVAGTWKDLTDNVNSMAANLTSQVRNIADVTTAVARGDLSKKITVDVQGEILELKNTINTMVDQLSTFASEVTRVAREVGTEGKLGGQARVKGVAGTWKDLTENVNSMAANLTSQVRNIAHVTTAVARGDLSKKITVDVKGEILELKNTINTMVDQLKAFASEVTRVAREVGTEGKLGGQARVEGVAGTWKDLTDNVNSMAANLTSQVRNIADVTTAVARGDLSRKITVDVRGEILALKNTINTMVDQLKAFASEVTRVAREVGTEGKLGGQARVEGVAGTWKDLTENVNSMAANLTSQVRNIADVTTAVARGDLSRKITVDVKGEILELKNTINTMVDQLKGFASEVTRVAREVGTEGKLGGQAQVKGVAGTWKDLTENVNSMAANLTSQVRNIADVTTAVARGDLSKKITVDVKGEILALKNTINTMVDQLKGFASEVTRVAREVGTEGKLGGQARVEGVAGTWKDLTDNVNSMAANLTSQVRNIADVTTAVARGDLSRKITVDVQGEILALKNTINTMVDQLKAFASEVTRVAREVGTEGKLGGQARVEGVGGTWKDLTDNVNSMADNLTSQVRNIADVTTAVARGDLSKKVTVEVKGEILELKDTINTMVDQLNGFASEVTRVAKEVGTDGRLGGQAFVRGVGGTWKDLTDSVNSMADNLTSQVRNIAEVTTAVANGDLSRKITVDVKGEILELKNTINTMVDQLNAFASEVTRVAREVGTEGNLGGQAQVRGVAGTWKDLTDNVNTMADNLTSQVRGIARVVTAVANGDLKQKLVLEAKGEIAILADTINEMIGTLAVFAEQVSGVAREVGVEGRLGGQAQVPGAAGTWRALTDNVNGLAANLTTQVRAIAEVATAVTEGDLTRSITVEARGEVAALKDNINEMIRNLKETTQKNTRQDWLNSNLAKFGRMLQGQRDLQAVSRMVLSELAGLVSAQYGAFYVLEGGKEEPRLFLRATYAPPARRGDGGLPESFEVGEGLVGQCAIERERILLGTVPRDYVQVSSGLGSAAPAALAVLPVLFEGQVKAVMELGSFEPFSDTHLAFLDQLMESLGIVLNTIETTMQTEELLRQSQSLTERLRAQQEELQKTNEQLEEKARLLTEQKVQVEVKNRQVEFASEALEEKAAQLALASKYKSEFLANMSHELRTPLNSLLILAKLLADDAEGNLTSKQIEFAETIYSSGRDLLALINEILDLSKIESGTMPVDVGDVPLGDLAEFAERGFRQVADDKSLEFEVVLDPELRATIRTDARRLQQVLRNLLSNAFKFTEHGGVSLRIARANGGWNPNHEILSMAPEVVSFSVADTGIGIPADKQEIIFEAFQQADGTTSRRFGGTGLGLSISREIARILGGSIGLASTAGKGSTFTLFLPAAYGGSASAAHRATTIPLPASRAGAALPAQANGAAAGSPAGALASVATATEAAPAAADDRASIRQGDRVLLLVDDDRTRTEILLDLLHEHGFKGVVSSRSEWAMSLARLYRPRGLFLAAAQTDAERVGAMDRLWHDPSTRMAPIHVLWTGGSRPAARIGLRTYVRRPLTSEALREALTRVRAYTGGDIRSLLVVTADDAERRRVLEALQTAGARGTAVSTPKEVGTALEASVPDAALVDLSLPEHGAEIVLEGLRRDAKMRAMPIVLLCDAQAVPENPQNLAALAARMGGDRAQAESLLSEAALFLNRVKTSLSEPRLKLTGSGGAPETRLAGKKVLVVDDDVRNVFAITSMLERQDIRVDYATSGRDAIASLEKSPDVDAVLMDIMMPGMDGYETMRGIRKNQRFAALPIVALTAKAMAGDREKCLEAGASDYITKPVEADQLLALLRLWLSR